MPTVTRRNELFGYYYSTPSRRQLFEIDYAEAEARAIAMLQKYRTQEEKQVTISNEEAIVLILCRIYGKGRIRRSLIGRTGVIRMGFVLSELNMNLDTQKSEKFFLARNHFFNNVNSIELDVQLMCLHVGRLDD